MRLPVGRCLEGPTCLWPPEEEEVQRNMSLDRAVQHATGNGMSPAGVTYRKETLGRKAIRGVPLGAT